MKKTPEIRFPEFSGEWVEKRLGEVGEAIIGLTYSPKDIDNNGIIVLRSSNIKDNKLNLNDLVKVNKKLPEKLKLKNNDIVICVRNGSQSLIGKSIIVKNPQNMTFGAFMSVFRSDYNKFVYYLFQTKSYKKQIYQNLGARINQITNKQLLNFKFSIPPTLAEQQKIADFLSSVDEKIEIVAKKIEELKKYKKGLLQKLLNVNDKGEPELRFEGFSGKWVEKRLGEVLKERKEYTKKTNNITHLTLSKDGIFPKIEQFNRDFLVIDKNKKYKVTYFNDICYNPANLKFGVICRNKYGKGIFSPIYVTFETYNISPTFIENIIISSNFINKALKYQEGTVYERMAVKPEDLLKLKIFIPPTLTEQEKIAEFLSSIDEKIELNEKRLQVLKEYKKSLLQKMFV